MVHNVVLDSEDAYELLNELEQSMEEMVEKINIEMHS